MGQRTVRTRRDRIADNAGQEDLVEMGRGSRCGTFCGVVSAVCRDKAIFEARAHDPELGRKPQAQAREGHGDGTKQASVCDLRGRKTRRSRRPTKARVSRFCTWTTTSMVSGEVTEDLERGMPEVFKAKLLDKGENWTGGEACFRYISERCRGLQKTSSGPTAGNIR